VNVNSAAMLVAVHVAVWSAALLVLYQYFLLALPCMFRMEIGALSHAVLRITCVLVCSVLCTHNVWARLCPAAMLQDYADHSFYEFDVDLDLRRYVSSYIIHTYLHVAACACGRWLGPLLVVVFVAGIIELLDLVYYAILVTTCCEISLLSRFVMTQICCSSRLAV
jgi:hypothetical protein